MTDKESLKKLKASVVMDFGDKTYAILMGDKDTCVKRSMLIATAPELLEALIEMQRNGRKKGWDDKYESSMEKTRLAIAKALGQQ
ncbi:hypothetical protein ACNART_08380 [Proteus sp. LHD240705]|uniref:hypothetical protein n=1 Tax=Proteus sp. LHD240705 TaxID=3400183 RepID=UPI003A4E5F77